MAFKFNITRKKFVLTSMLLILLSGMVVENCTGPSESIDLEAGFKNPPNSARPRVWWHWMNGNITKHGIRADLEWMHRVGVGGFQTFDAALQTPKIVDERLQYMTPDWKDAFQLATKLADSLDMEMAIAGSPGWSESGGPWVQPAQGMKKYVWSETRIQVLQPDANVTWTPRRIQLGQPFKDTLPKPPTITGPFQNIPFQEGGISNDEGNTKPQYYQDVAVVAYRLPDDDMTLSAMQPKVTSSGGNFNLDQLTDGDLATTTLLPAASVGEKAWVQYEFSQPETFQSLTIVGGGGGRRFGRGPAAPARALEVSDDGQTFRTVAEIPAGGSPERTLEFDPVTAKYFRFTFETPPPPSNGGGGLFGNAGQSAPSGTQIAELELHSGARVNRFEDKAAFDTATHIYDMATPSVPQSDAVSKNDVIDLTSKMNDDGTVTWTPPEGNWMILRLGYSLLGITNHPATAEATGLEVDKMSAEDVQSYFNNYLDQYKDATGGLMGQQGLQYVITDSWEAGAENWTENMMDEFRQRRGYDMTPWLPVLTGHVVQSAEASDRFLWDFRQTIADLIEENHYDQLTNILKERGMKGRYSESHETGRALIADGMDVKRTAAVPMSAMWMPGGFNGNGTQVPTGDKADVRESASVAHIYGQNLAAAESMTSAGSLWGWSPQTLKPTADMELASGLNRFVIHESAHQPLDNDAPGLTLGPFGQTFDRLDNWAEQARPWVTYLARSSYMLQQGQFVADVAYYYGQDSNITALFTDNDELPPVPEGYNFDFVNADALVNLFSVSDGSLVTPSGMSYRILVLGPNSRHMTLPVLQKIRDLVQNGAIVVGQKPLGTPSLSDDEDAFQSLANQLWTNENGVNTVGDGKIYAGQSIADVLSDLNISPDFEYTKPENDTNLLYVHRKMDNTDIYWVDNRNDRTEDVDATFRVDGRQAELWNPVTGDITPASYTIANGVTQVPLHLDPNGTVFVVFRNQATESSRTVPPPTEQQLMTLQGPWDVSFQANRGAPAQAEFNSLTPWNENSNDGIKYFSGTGTYTKTIQAPADWFNEGTQLWLDLGDVKSLAEVDVNGDSLGIVWKKPFRINVTDALHQGTDTLEIKVTNLWVNRLIGDQQPGVTQTYTYTTQDFYSADDPLKTSGLLGPVQIISSTSTTN